MSAPSAELVAVVVALIDALEPSGLPYAFGGALALSTWSEPRSTADVDLNAWVDASHLDGLFQVLEAAGATVDRPQAKAEAAERGMFVAWHSGFRVDIFVPSVPFYDEALARRQRTEMVGRPSWVLSAESLAVFKMLFFRPKDLIDLRRMLEIQGRAFDRAFVRRWLVDMVGESDPRIVEWDAMPPSS